MTDKNQAKLHRNVFYFSTFNAARDRLRELVAAGDANDEARINYFGKGWAIQQRRSGRYWGEVSNICPEAGEYVAEGWSL